MRGTWAVAGTPTLPLDESMLHRRVSVNLCDVTVVVSAVVYTDDGVVFLLTSVSDVGVEINTLKMDIEIINIVLNYKN